MLALYAFLFLLLVAASIPIALDELMEKGMLKSGDHVMLIGLGAGLTWGGVIYRLP